MECNTAEMKELLVKTLMLDGCDPASIDDDAVLFGGGLDLDSVDALELVLALKKTYGIEVKPEHENNKEIFQSVRSLAEFVTNETK
mgnify:CR=1 FL=1|jgi:acyl carrier protein